MRLTLASLLGGASLAPLLLFPAPAAGQEAPTLHPRVFGSDDTPPPGQAPAGQLVVMRLEYVRARGCPEEGVFRDLVTSAVRRWNPFAPNAPWRLVVVLALDPRGFTGSAELHDRAGALEWRREFPATPTCAALASDLATAIGVRLDPARPPPLSIEGRAVPPAELPAAPAPVAPESAPPSPSPSAPVMFRLGAAGSLDLGTAPRPAAGVSVDVGLQVQWFSLEIEGHWDPPAGAMVATGATVTTSRYFGALIPCGHVGWFAGCLVAQVGALSGSIPGPAGNMPDAQTALYTAAGVRPRVEIPAVPSRLFVWLAGDLLGARPVGLRLGGVPQWVTASVVGSVGTGLVAKFW